MRIVFLNKFFPPGRTNALMRAIQNFSQKPSESFATVWERYKELLHVIPHYGLDIDQIVAYFHQGLSPYSKLYIQMMSGGQFYEKSPEEAVQCFDSIAENAQNWESNTSLDSTRVHSMPIGGGKHHVKENDDLQAKIATLTRKLKAIEMQKVNKVTTVPKVPSAPTGPRMEDSCIICDDPTHLIIDFPNLPQVKGAIQIEQANDLNYPRKPFNSPYSETYDPGWSKHPNFSWKSDEGHVSSGQGNPPQNPFQSNLGFPNQNFQSQNFQSQGFSNQAPHFHNQGPHGFSTNPSQSFHHFPQGNQNHQPYQPPHKRNLEDIVAQFVQSQQSTNTELRMVINDVRSQITKLIASMGISQQEKGNSLINPFKTPKVKIVLGLKPK